MSLTQPRNVAVVLDYFDGCNTGSLEQLAIERIFREPANGDA